MTNFRGLPENAPDFLLPTSGCRRASNRNQVPRNGTSRSTQALKITLVMETPLSELELALGHGFRRPELLVCALTHRSVANEQQAQGADSAGNERLEFLGDAILGLVVAEDLFLRYPEWREGDLTRVRAQLVSRQHIADVADAIGLGRHILLSRGEDRAGLRSKSTVLSNAMEAVLGAMFLDSGLDTVRGFVQRQVIGQFAERFAAELRAGAALGNYKSALQEHLQAARAGIPVYRVKNESGPDHRKRFLVEVRLKRPAGEAAKPDSQPSPVLTHWSNGQPLARGLGRTKKHAEQDAARRALARLTGATAATQPLEEPAAE